jgi:hypothetical protein
MKACRPRRFDGLLKTGSILSSQRCHCNVRVLQKEYGKAARVSGSFSGSRPGLCHADCIGRIQKSCGAESVARDNKPRPQDDQGDISGGETRRIHRRRCERIRRPSSQEPSRQPPSVHGVRNSNGACSRRSRMAKHDFVRAVHGAAPCGHRVATVDSCGRIRTCYQHPYETVTSTELRSPPCTTAKLLIYKILRQHLWR